MYHFTLRSRAKKNEKKGCAEAERAWGGARGGERIVIELMTSDRELKASREGSKCKDVRCPTCPETWLKLRAGACFAQLLLKL